VVDRSDERDKMRFSPQLAKTKPQKQGVPKLERLPERDVSAENRISE
jgi:hypothetical protein